MGALWEGGGQIGQLPPPLVEPGRGKFKKTVLYLNTVARKNVFK